MATFAQEAGKTCVQEGKSGAGGGDVGTTVGLEALVSVNVDMTKGDRSGLRELREWQGENVGCTCKQERPRGEATSPGDWPALRAGVRGGQGLRT